MKSFKRSRLRDLANEKGITDDYIYRESLKTDLRSQIADFDIFLSHRMLDAKEVYVLAEIIRNFGYSVYIDWEIDPDLNRNEISAKTALKLKKRMNQSRSLIFVTTKNYSDSKWMPWELGFMDGRTSKVSILPVVDDLKEGEEEFIGQEYLGIYPKIEIIGGLFLELDPKTYTNYWYWLNGRFE